MDDEIEEPSSEARPGDVEGVRGRIIYLIGEFVHGVELATAALFALLFAIGVVDLSLQIVEAGASGRITSPDAVVGIIDTGLLLLIIVEVYQTVIAYIRRSETRYVLRLIIYTGIIAMVRKVIIYRTDDYATMQNALFAAVAYTMIMLGLGGLLLVERRYSE